MIILVSVAVREDLTQCRQGWGTASGWGAGSVVLNASSMLPAEVSRKKPMVLEAGQSLGKHSLGLAVITSNPTPSQRAIGFPPD